MLSPERIIEIGTEQFGEVFCLRAADALFARAIESAATAPLLARIAELEKDCDRFERYWNEAMATHKNIAELERQLEEARKDAELLDWMIFYSARVGHDSDGEFCQCIWINEDGEQRTKLFGNAREAIRAAIKEQT